MCNFYINVLYENDILFVSPKTPYVQYENAQRLHAFRELESRNRGLENEGAGKSKTGMRERLK